LAKILIQIHKKVMFSKTLFVGRTIALFTVFIQKTCASNTFYMCVFGPDSSGATETQIVPESIA